MYLDPAMSPCGGHAAPMSITVSCARPWPQGCSSYLACELASCVGFGPVSVVNKEFFLVWLRPPAFGREWLSFRGPVRRHLTMPQPRGSVAEGVPLMRSLLCPRLSPFCSASACLQIWRGWHHLPLPLCLALTLGYLLGPCCWGPGWLASASLPVSLGGCGLAGWHCVLDHILEVLMAERLLLLCPRPRARRGPSVLVAALPSH